MLYIKKKYFAVFVLLLPIVYLYSQYQYLYYKDMRESKEMMRFSERNMHLDVTCYNHKDNKIGLPQFKHVLRKMFVDTVHNISWCPVYKSGSSVWQKGFAQLGGVLNERVLNFLDSNIITWNMLARKAYPRKHNLNDIYESFNKTKSFLIVRHPFDRILSMYRASWNNNIMRKNVFFKEQPSFRNFLNTLVTNYSSFDKDWLPIYRQCLPCLLHYNYIIKIEYFVEDTLYMINELGLEKYLNLKLEKRSIDYKVTEYYYKLVPLDLLEKLYELYKEDFVFFDYSPDTYYDLSNC